jgi:DNA-binding NarL/FixJ family response regulator
LLEAAGKSWYLYSDVQANLTAKPSRSKPFNTSSKSEKPKDPLTARELQVLQLIAEGKSTKDIASLLAISVKTVESHRTRLMQKLNIHETASLVRYAVRRGIVQA